MTLLELYNNFLHNHIVWSRETINEKEYVWVDYSDCEDVVLDNMWYDMVGDNIPDHTTKNYYGRDTLPVNEPLSDTQGVLLFYPTYHLIKCLLKQQPHFCEVEEVEEFDIKDPQKWDAVITKIARRKGIDYRWSEEYMGNHISLY